MDLEFVGYEPKDYIVTHSGNKVSRKSTLCGSRHIVLHGKSIIHSNVVIRGDLAAVRIGEYCVISNGVVLRPPFKEYAKGVAFFPLHIGNNVFIGEDSIVNAAQIGSFVKIGKRCVIGRRAVLKDCCIIDDDTYVPPETIVASFKKFSGSPSETVGNVPECAQDLMIQLTYTYYQNFVPHKYINPDTDT